MDFGLDIPEEMKTRQGMQIRYHGEWHLWIYQCRWHIKQNERMLVNSESPKVEIEATLLTLGTKAFSSFKLLNDYFDAELKFENMTLSLFHSQEGEQWMLFTPENKTFVAGPGLQWDYRDSF